MMPFSMGSASTFLQFLYTVAVPASIHRNVASFIRLHLINLKRIVIFWVSKQVKHEYFRTRCWINLPAIDRDAIVQKYDGDYHVNYADLPDLYPLKLFTTSNICRNDDKHKTNQVIDLTDGSKAVSPQSRCINLMSSFHSHLWYSIACCAWRHVYVHYITHMSE